MNSATRAGIAYFAGMFVLGFLLGAVRVLVLTPMLGDWPATFIELPVMLAISWFYCAALLQRMAISRRVVGRLLMGSVAFTLLMIAEVLLGVGLFERSLPRQLREMTNGVGIVGLAGQLAFAAFPLLQLRYSGGANVTIRG